MYNNLDVAKLREHDITISWLISRLFINRFRHSYPERFQRYTVRFSGELSSSPLENTTAPCIPLTLIQQRGVCVTVYGQA